MGGLFALINAAGWSVGMVFARRGQQTGRLDTLMGLYTTLLVNSALNLLLLLGTVLFSTLPQLNTRGMVCLVLGGVFNSLIGRGLLFCSIAKIGAARAGVVKASTPVFALLGGVFLLKEEVLPLQWLGIAVVLGGVVVISLDAARREGKRAGRAPLSGVAIGVVASMFLAAGNICRKLGVGYIPNSALGVTVGSVSAAVVLTSFLLLRGRGGDMAKVFRPLDGNYAMSGVCTSFALFFLFHALELIPLSIANSLTALEPLFTLAFSRLLLGKQEKVTWQTGLGAAATVLGAVILTRG